MNRRITFLAGLAMLGIFFAVMFAGCASSGSDSQAIALCESETSKSFVRPFEVDKAQYPFKSCIFETGHGKMQFFDEGPRDAKETILMVHGNPIWRFTLQSRRHTGLPNKHCLRV